MDSYEASRTVFSRIQSLEPENASKIMGYLLIQDYGEKEMIRLAFGPETLLQNLIFKAKTQLGLLTKPLSSPSTPSSPSPFNPISRPNPLTLSSSSSSSSRIASNGFELSNPPTPSSNAWPLSPSSGHVLSYASVVNRTSANTNSGSFSSTLSSLSSAYNSTSELFDDYPLQDNALSLSNSTKTDDLFDPRLEWASMAASPSEHDDLQKQSYSVPGLYYGSEDANSGFRPCLYFARGFCKNGETCRFVHGDPTGEAFNGVGSPNNSLSELEQCQELLRLKAAAQQRKLASASQFMAGTSFPYDNKCMNLLMQRQIDTSRSSTAAMMMGDDFHKFGRCRFDRNELNLGGANPSARQIYLTFPADSTFREEDVSNYFSIYGPVQDVRIPYQQKRMFGFVTFVYPDTVKLILAKGNPHFVCDSRVLVKPYKEKGKIVEKKQQQQQQQFESGDYSLCSSPSGLDYDLHNGPRMFYNTQEMLLMKKLEEQASFQQAIELHERRLMNLQLIDLKNHHHHRHDQYHRSVSSVSSIPSPTALSYSTNNQVHIVPSDQSKQEVCKENNDKSAATILQNAGLDAEQQLELELNPACYSINGSREFNSGNGKELAKTEENESIEHSLPDSLFASPKKSATDHTTAFSSASEEPKEMENTSNSNNTSLLSTSTINIASPKSVFTKCSGFHLGMEPLECN